ALEHGRIGIGLVAPDERIASQLLADATHLFLGPVSALAAQSINERVIREEQIVGVEGRRLIRAVRRHDASNSRTRASSQPIRISWNIARAMSRWWRAAPSSPIRRRSAA